MLESLAAVVAAAVLSPPVGVPSSVVVTHTVERQGNAVGVQQHVLVDGQSYLGPRGSIDCSTEVRDALCDATDAVPDARVTVTRHRGDDGEIITRVSARAGTFFAEPWATISCEGNTGGALCAVADALDG